MNVFLASFFFVVRLVFFCVGVSVQCRIPERKVSHESTAPLEIQKKTHSDPYHLGFMYRIQWMSLAPPTFRQFETPHLPLFLHSFIRYSFAFAFFFTHFFFSSFCPCPAKFAYMYLDVLSTQPTPHDILSAYGRNMKYNHIKYHFRIIMSEHIFHHQFWNIKEEEKKRKCRLSNVTNAKLNRNKDKIMYRYIHI